MCWKMLSGVCSRWHCHLFFPLLKTFASMTTWLWQQCWRSTDNLGFDNSINDWQGTCKYFHCSLHYAHTTPGFKQRTLNWVMNLYNKAKHTTILHGHYAGVQFIPATSLVRPNIFGPWVTVIDRFHCILNHSTMQEWLLATSSSLSCLAWWVWWPSSYIILICSSHLAGFIRFKTLISIVYRITRNLADQKFGKIAKILIANLSRLSVGIRTCSSVLLVACSSTRSILRYFKKKPANYMYLIHKDHWVRNLTRLWIVQLTRE